MREHRAHVSLLRRLAVFAHALLLVGLLHAHLAAAGSEASGNAAVRFIQVLHRHGARAGIPKHNNTLLCTEAPCGHLSPNGIVMMKRVGTFLRTRYNADRSVTPSPLFSSADYNLELVYSRSTDVLRTLQSAEAFLSGLFPAAETRLPAIHTVAKTGDTLLSITATVPYLRMYIHNHSDWPKAFGNAKTDAAFPSWEVLREMGASAHSAGLCERAETRATCAVELFDLAAAKKAAGELARFPLLQERYSQLYAVALATFTDRFHYDKTNDLHLKQGGRGRVFVRELLQNIDDHIHGVNNFKMMHYSAHDSTLAPVWATLGDRSDNGMLPPFAQTLVAELLQDGAGAYHVRVLRGHPGQDPESGFGFAWDATWRMRCVDASGALYVAADNTCPLADFRRLVAWSAPTSPSGLCYLDEEFMRVRACPEDVGATAATATAAAAAGEGALSETCRYYRERCPDYSCPETGCVLNAVTLQCMCMSTALSVSAFSGLVVGAVIGATAMLLLLVVRFVREPTHKYKD